jgi:hypothetical protein
MQSEIGERRQGQAPTRPAAIWQRLRDWMAPPPVATAAELELFLSQRAAYLAQKCVIDYCRGKAGMFHRALFEERRFQEALDVCRWESFAAALAAAIVLAERLLMPAAPAGAPAQRMSERLRALYPAILGSYPLPAHRGGDSWQREIADFSLNAGARGTLYLSPVELADKVARRMFDTLPIHSRMRQLDEEIVFGAVRFQMVGLSDLMRRRFDVDALVRDLAADEGR